MTFVEDQGWILLSKDNPEVFAQYNQSEVYPFGKRVWTVHGEPCFQGRTEQVELQVLGISI